jgi:tetratricopeptide (TPR) repeat protein
VQDPQFLAGERAIEEAGKAAAIVSSLPDGRISTAVFVVLSALYRGRGDSLARKDGDGNPILDTANSQWYHKALSAALRGVAVDRAQNQNHRQAELARGAPPDRIGLAGLPDAYLNLGTAYLRLGEPAKALEAFLYERRLAPGLPAAYSNLASVYMAQNKTEEAATLLLESFVLHESSSTLSRLGQLYGRIDGGACAIAGHGEDRSLNYDCPVVRRGLCQGYRDIEAAFREARQDETADRFRRAGALESVCQ